MTPPAPRADTSEMHAADVATFRSEIAHLQRQFNEHDRDDKEMQRVVFRKLDDISRLIWVAFGGVIVIGGVIALIGGSILKLLAH